MSRKVKTKLLALIDEMTETSQAALLVVLENTTASADGLDDLDDAVVRKPKKDKKKAEKPKKGKKGKASDDDEEESDSDDEDDDDSATVPPLTKLTLKGVQTWMGKIEAVPATGSIKELSDGLKGFGIDVKLLNEQIEGGRSARAEEYGAMLAVLEAAASYINEEMDEDDVAELAEALGLEGDDFSGEIILSVVNGGEEPTSGKKSKKKVKKSKKSDDDEDEDEDDDLDADEEDADEEDEDDDLEDLDDDEDEDDEPKSKKKSSKKSKRAKL